MYTDVVSPGRKFDQSVCGQADCGSAFFFAFTRAKGRARCKKWLRKDDPAQIDYGGARQDRWESRV